MATIIDALIVTLGLDARKFKDGSKEVQSSLDQTTRAAEQAADDMAKAASKAADDKVKSAKKESDAAEETASKVAAAAQRAAAEQVKASEAATKAAQRATDATKEAAAKTAEAAKVAAAAQTDASQKIAAGNARSAADTATANAKVAQSSQTVTAAKAAETAATAAAANKNLQIANAAAAAAVARTKAASDDAALRAAERVKTAAALAAANAADASKRKALEQDRIRQDRQRRDEENKSAREGEDRSKIAAEGYRKVRNEVLGLLAVFTAGRGIKDFARDITTADAAAGRMATQIGISVEDLGAWQQAVQRTGGSASALDTTLNGLAQQFQEKVATGSSGLFPYMQQLNLQFEEFVDQQGKFHPEQMLMAFSKRIKELHLDAATATNIGQGLGIDQGTLNLLLQGNDNVEQMLRHVRGLGVATQEDVDKAQRLSTAYLGVKQSIETAARVVLRELSPYITDALNFVTRWVSDPKNQKWFSDEIVKDVRLIADGIKGFVTGANDAAQAVGGWQNATKILFGLWLGAKFLGVMANLAKFTAAAALAGRAAAPAGPAVAGGGALGFLGRVLGPLSLLAAVGVGTGGDTEHGTEEQQIARNDAIARERREALTRGRSDQMSQDGGPTDRVNVSAGELTPEELLKTIQLMPMGSMAGKNVNLNTGLQNDPTQTAAVEEQIAALKARGAKDVKIAGLDAQLIEANEHLAEIALKLGVGFGAYNGARRADGGNGGTNEPQQNWWQRLFGIPATGSSEPNPEQGTGRGGEGAGGGGGRASGLPAPTPGPDNATQQARARESMQFWQDRGYTAAQAAGFTARIKLESGFNENAVPNTGEDAYGNFQHHSDRRRAIALGMGEPIIGASYHRQLEMAAWELEHPEIAARRAIQATTTPEEAGRTVSRRYIRPGLDEPTRAREAERTAALARRYYDEDQQRRRAQPPAGTATPPAGAPTPTGGGDGATPSPVGFHWPSWLPGLPSAQPSPAVSSTRVSSNETNFNGDIAIHVPSGDPDAIAAGLRDSLRRSAVTPNSNVGLV